MLGGRSFKNSSVFNLAVYTENRMHGILKVTFEEVSRQYKEETIADDEPPKQKTSEG